MLYNDWYPMNTFFGLLHLILLTSFAFKIEKSKIGRKKQEGLIILKDQVKLRFELM